MLKHNFHASLKAQEALQAGSQAPQNFHVKGVFLKKKWSGGCSGSVF